MYNTILTLSLWTKTIDNETRRDSENQRVSL